MNPRRLVFLLILVAAALLFRPLPPTTSGDDWQPIDPADLKMTSEPKAPGAPAIYLYRQVDRDDQSGREAQYYRIKIFTEEGRKQADVEIPFLKDVTQINGIKARTIRPDGSIANFDGKVYEKTIVKARGVKYLAKTFTLPDVQVGSIIEYKFASSWSRYPLYDSRWIISSELYTKRAKFTLKPDTIFTLRCSWHNLPPGSPQPVNEHSSIHLEINDIAAFQVEDFMPPQDELKARVNFVYNLDNDEKEPEKFWKKEGKKRFELVDAYLNKKRPMEQAVGTIVSPSDTADLKLRKIYARVQQVRNLSFEDAKTDKERQREKQKELNNVADVWKTGYADGSQINYLFIALCRAAGLDAYSVIVSRRDDYFFEPAMMNPRQLNDNIVLVKADGKDLYFDPGTLFTPFGLLPWAETFVRGLKLDKDGGTWVQTPLPDSSASRITRVADLRMDDRGGLQGKLTVTYTGLEALRRRLEERNEDDADKRKFLEDGVKESVPVVSDVELTNQPDWKSSSDSLVAVFDFKTEGWASSAGRQALIPVGLFGAPEKHLFEHADRVHPIYFEYPTEVRDDITINMPLNWFVKALPAEQNQNSKVIVYTMKVEDQKGTEHISRVLKLDILNLDVKYYGALRNFYQGVKNGDEEQIVVQPGA
ncbi:MAG TPA: DUF3857 domain-containing protein [Candidatus Acidoferrum sp.]|nr:DUF3857 domain-containing protein [Candidatus Acidoferrum sp.]